MNRRWQSRARVLGSRARARASAVACSQCLWCRRVMRARFAVLLFTACSASTNGEGGPTATYDMKYEGGEFHLGPVDWAESQWHNACAPGSGYLPAVRQAEGTLLVGLWSGI